MKKEPIKSLYNIIEYEDIFILSKPFYNKPISYNN